MIRDSSISFKGVGEPPEQEQLLRGRGHLRGRRQLRANLAVVLVSGDEVGLAAVVAGPHLRDHSGSGRCDGG